MRADISMWSCPCVCDVIEFLKIHQLRNLHAVSMPLSDCNVLVGGNGSGKTSLLEAVFLLSRGKSFRHHEPKRYITHTKRACVIWAKTASGELALQKALDDKGFAVSTIKKDGQNVSSQSTLSQALPVCLLDPSGVGLLEVGSHERRQLLDWVVFHVEHRFYGEWLSYQRILKQRNLLLKSPNVRQRLGELGAWDYQLSVHAERLFEYRQAVFDEWQRYFGVLLAQFLPIYQQNITLGHQAGFDEKIGLLPLLKNRLLSDIELGYTRIGSHRADVLVGFVGEMGGQKVKEQAVNVLSRGEKKLLIATLKLSQIQLLCDKGVRPVVLIDDIDAELDEQAVDMLLDRLLALPCQLIVTTLQSQTGTLIAQKMARGNPPKAFKMFHVKQGEVQKMMG
ncbi:MAG: DNA replication and repair protein RecF [Moraxella sp.]|nr:DNA replication and repair protein RecF [Moraxella sp.]